jgi:hypothetical protein
MATTVMNAKATGVWMGVRRCGCPVAVVTEYGDDAPKSLNAHVAQCKREFLRDGLSVVYATWGEWVNVHSLAFKRECEHVRTAKDVPLPLADDAVGRR